MFQEISDIRTARKGRTSQVLKIWSGWAIRDGVAACRMQPHTGWLGYILEGVAQPPGTRYQTIDLSTFPCDPRAHLFVHGIGRPGCEVSKSAQGID